MKDFTPMIESVKKQKTRDILISKISDYQSGYNKTVSAYNDNFGGWDGSNFDADYKDKYKNVSDTLSQTSNNARSIIKLLELNKQYFDDEYDEIYNSLVGSSENISSMQENADSYNSFYSQFENAAAFNDYAFKKKYNGKTLSEIDDIIKNFSADGSAAEKRWLLQNRDSFMNTNDITSEIASLEGQSAGIKKEKALAYVDYAKQAFGAFLGLGSTADVSFDTSAADTEKENNARLQVLKNMLAAKDDFDVEAAYKKADEKNFWDVITTDYTYADYLNDKDSKNIYGNAVVNQRDEENLQIINDNSELKNDLALYATHVAAGNAGQAASNLFSNIFPGNNRTDYTPPTSAMVEISQKWIDAGYDFYELYDSYKKNYNKEFTQEITDDTSDFIKKNLGNTVLGNVASVGVNVLGGMAALPSAIETGIEDAFSDDIVTLDTNAPEWMLKNVTDSIRDTTSQMISEKAETDFGAEIGNFFYQTGMSMADMGAATLVSGKNLTGMQLIMGSNAAIDSIKTVTENGGSTQDALLTGLMSGIFEALFEKVSIDNLFRTATSDTGKKLVANFVKGFLSEGSEELCTDIANSFADALINGNNSEYNQSVNNYMAQGKSASEARSLAMLDTMKQMGLSFAGGALSGGTIAGVGGSFTLANANRQYASEGKNILSAGNTDAVMELANSILKNQQNPDLQYDVDAINKVENKTFKKNGKSEITKAVENRLGEFGVTESDVVKRVTNAYLNDTEYRKSGNAITDKYAARVLSELRSSDIESERGNFSNEWAVPVVDKARADAKAESVKKYRAKDIGRLASDVRNAIINNTQENIDAEIKKGIQSRAEELGIDKSTSATAADIIYKAFMGDKLTISQNKILDNNSKVKRIYNELMSAAEHGINKVYSNLWVAPVLDIRAAASEKLAKLSGDNRITETQTAIDDNKSTVDINDIVINGSETFSAFVEQVRSEKMKYGVVKKYNAKNIDNSTAGQIAVLDAYGRKHGLSFIVVDSIGSDNSQKANGAYIGKNKIMVSLSAEGGALLSVSGHEVYHYIKENNAEAAKTMHDFVISALKNNSEYNYDKRFKELAEIYGTENAAVIEEEMVANAMFDVLSDEKLINELAKENPSLLEKIVAAIKDFIAEFKKMIKSLPWDEARALENDIETLDSIRVMAETALWQIENNKTAETEGNVKISTSENIETEENVKKIKNTASEDGVVKYSIKIDIDGNKYVDVENRIFDKSNGISHASIIAKLISEKFKNLIIINKQKIRINAVTNKEWRRSPDAQKLIRTSPDIYYDKLNAIQNAEEILRVARNWVGEKIQHKRKDDISEFARGIINYKIGDNGYSADILVATKKDGSALLYDILHIKEKIITDASRGSYGDSGASRQDTSVTVDNISQNDSSVNTEYAQNGKDNTTKFSLAKPVERTKELIAVHNMTVEELQKSLNLGGLPMPSIAVIKAERGHSEYGDVSIVFPKEVIDPAMSSENKIYGGDVWSPVYPTIQFKVNEKVQEKISNLYDEIYQKYGRDEARPLYGFANDLEQKINGFRSEAEMIDSIKDNEDMMQFYLLANGKSKIAPVVKQNITEISDVEAEQFDYLINAIGKDVILELKTPAGENGIAHRRVYNEKYGAHIESAYKQMFKDLYNFTDDGISNIIANMGKNDLLKIVKQTYNYLQNGRTTITETEDRAGTSAAIRAAVKDSGFEKWVDDLFGGVVEKSGIRNNTDLFTASGKRRSWEALHWENNLENVVKVMKSQNNGSTALFPGHRIWAVASKNYNSIDDVRADSERLKSMPQEEYEAIKEDFVTRLNEIAASIMNKSESNQFIAIDNAMECIVDAISVSKTKSGILNELKQYRHLDVTETAVDDIVSLVSDIANMPTEYFEAKPQRAVMFDEIATVILPDAASSDIKQVLADRNISYVEYEQGNEQDRLKKLNSLDDVKFSFAGTKAKTADYSRLDAAIRLEDVGKATAEEIRQQTGWFRGYDNKWRFEIDDSKFEFNRKGFFTNPDVIRYQELSDKFLYGEITDEENAELKTLKKNLEGVKLRPNILGDYVKHDELFNAYPELKNLKVTFRSDMSIEDHGSYNPQKKEIVLNSAFAQDEEVIKRTLIHEIQHTIQDIEGFSGGADSRNPDYVRTAGEVEARDVSKRLGYDAEKRKNTRPDIDRTDVVFADGGLSYSQEYLSSNVNQDLLKLINNVKSKNYKDNDMLSFGNVTEKTANVIKNVTGIDVSGYKIAIEARQIYHILNDHGINGKSDNSMANDNDIARLAYVLDTYDSIIESGYTEAYKNMINGHNKSARTVLYEKEIGDNSYYIVQAVPQTKAKTLYVVTAFIGAKGYKKEASQFINAKSPDATSLNETVKTSNSIISNSDENVNIKLSLQETAAAGETREQLIRENDNLRVANTLLKKELQLTQGKMISFDNAKDIAKYLTTEYSSDYDNEMLSKEIYNIFNHYDKTGDYDYLMNYLTAIGKKVVARSSAIDYTLYDDYEDVRKWVKNMKFTLPEHVLRQLNENYDGKFVRKTFGRMRYVNQETHPEAPFLSQIYTELASEYPNFFSMEDNEYEQPMRLIEFWDKIQPTYYNPLNEMGYATEDDAAVGFAFDVFKAYSETDKLETFADKKKNEIVKLRKEYENNLERVKTKMTAERDRRLEQQKDYYLDAKEKSYEGKKRAYVKKKIRNVIKDLDKYLNRGSKDKNVKEDLQDTVKAALSAAELLFSEVPSNENIVRAGVSVFTEKEGLLLDEYAELLKKRDEYKEQYAENNKNPMSSEFLVVREKLNSLTDSITKRIKYLDKSLEEVFEREKRRLDSATVSEALSKLAATYSKIKDSEFSYIAQSYNQNVYDKIADIIKNNGDAKISLLTTKELDDIYVVYKMVLHTVRNANKVFTSDKKQTAEELGKLAMTQIRDTGGRKTSRMKALEFLKKFGWSELKPVYAFRVIGSDVLKERYAAMRNGEDTYYRDVSHAKAFYAKLREKYNTDEWKLDKGYEFTSKDDEKFTLSLEQIMSIYAYCRRGEQAVTHLTRGGFVFSDAITVEKKVKGKVIKYQVDDGSAYSLTSEVLAKINDVLDNKQRAYIEEMQQYLSDVMGNKGNEVSMEMYGVKLFNEKNYFPLKSSAFYKAFDGTVEGEAKLKNAGFAKETTPKATNPIVLDDFTNVWSTHVQDMAMYHSFVLPIEDFTKVFNYESHSTEGSDRHSLKATLQGAYGPAAEQYVRTLLTDLNNGVRSQNGAEYVNKMTGLAKKGAVFASMSVVIQQPSAVVRATALVNPKCFINAFPKSANWVTVSKQYDELKKYAPVAGIKEMGYFDTGFGKSTSEWITEREYTGFGKKFKGFFTDGNYRDDVFSMLAGKADEVSWVYIWNAVKNEVEASQKLTGEDLLTAAGKRFTEVVELTQVYDSVFSRSGLMRSKDTGVKMVTSFMAEPTTQINMLADAIISGKRGNKKYAAAVFGSVYASILVNAMLKSIVTAGRDDEEEFSYSEKYVSNLISSFISDGTIVSSIPFARDVISLIQGYDVERMDMTIIADVVNSIRAFESDKKTTFEKVMGLASSLLAVFGIPAKNIMKDVQAVINTYKNIATGYEYSPGALKEAIYREITGNNTPKSDLLYNAIMSGDTEYAERLKAKFKTESGYNSAIIEGLKKYDSRIYDAAVARMNGNTAEYMRLAKEIIDEKNFSQDNIVSAINSVINSFNDDTEEKAEKPKMLFTDSDYFDAVVGGDGKTADIVGKELVDADVANGKSQEDAEKSLVSSFRNNVKDSYCAGELDYEKAKNALDKFGGMSEAQAIDKLRYWDYIIDYPDYSLAEETVTKYYNDIEPSGISIEVYYEYYVNQKACKSDIDSNGNAISGSKKKKILEVINALPLTNEQKDVLYYQNNWSESKIDEAPWH